MKNHQGRPRSASLVATCLAAVALSLAGNVDANADASPATPRQWWRFVDEPGLTIHTSVRTYSVRGKTRSQIETSMAQAGAKEIGSDRAIGSHEPAAHLSYGMLPFGSGCSLSSHAITYSGRTTLPRWDKPSGVKSTVAHWWRSTQEDIAQHEQEHAFIAVMYFAVLNKVLDEMPNASTCGALKADVSAAFNAAWRRGQSANKEFDDWTNHGTRGHYWIG